MNNNETAQKKMELLKYNFELLNDIKKAISRVKKDGTLQDLLDVTGILEDITQTISSIVPED